jgi:hypothetical protein
MPRDILLTATLLSALTCAAYTQQPPEFGGFRGPGNFLPFAPFLESAPSRAGLLNSPDVQAELNLSDQQKQRLNELLRQPGFGGLPGPGFGPPGFGPPGGLFGPEQKLVSEYDRNHDGWLNAQERKPARESLANRPARGRGGPPGFGGGPPGVGPPGGGPFGGMPFGGRGGPPGFGSEEPGKPGLRVAVADVPPLSNKSLYDPQVLRTLFLEFETDDWEAELEDFHGTDVDVPATLTVDGQKYPNVGVHFRGMSSYMAVPRGSKRSLNLSLDMADPNQRLYGYKTLNLLNAHEDPSQMHTVLYSHIARQYIPAPRANFVKLVVNGESWGVYVNVQQFDKIFLTENYKKAKGTRWKVRGSPGGGGGLDYVGDNIDNYRRRYEIKSEDSDKAWRELVKFCKAMEETPSDKLVETVGKRLDLDGVLWFLALDNALINCDGYWIRASDYSIFRDDQGLFHIIPHDMNEAFQPPMGPGFGPPPGFGGGPPGFGGGRPASGNDAGGRGGPPGFGQPGRRGASLDLDPLIGLDDQSKPLRSKLLSVPELRRKYLDHVRTIAEKDLDWKKLGPVVEQFAARIDKEVAADTRKLASYEAFQRAVAVEPAASGLPGGPSLSLRTFADERRAYLMEYSDRHR